MQVTIKQSCLACILFFTILKTDVDLLSTPFRIQSSPEAKSYFSVLKDLSLHDMAQRSAPSALALGGLAAGGLVLLNSGSQQEAFATAPAVAGNRNLRAQAAAQKLPSATLAAAPSVGVSALPAIACGGVLAAAAVAGSRSSKRQSRTPLPTSVVPMKQSIVARRALDQSSRYADLSLDEEQLIKSQTCSWHVLLVFELLVVPFQTNAT